MRVRLPKRVSKALGLRSRQTLNVYVKKGKIIFSKPKKGVPMSPMWRDILERPFHTKVQITTELLEKIGETQWE